MTTAVKVRCQGCGNPVDRPHRRGRTPKWCSERCRKQTLYAGTCIDCGARTNGYDGPGTASKRCAPCNTRHQQENATWTRERILADGRRWQALFGRLPTTGDWNRFMARGERRELLDRIYALTGPWPHCFIVLQRFGSWREFIAELGGEAYPMYDGGRGRPRDYRTVEARRFLVLAEAAASTPERGKASA